MNPLQFGSGTNTLGGGDAVAALNEAVQRRNQGAGITAQSSVSPMPMPQSPQGQAPQMPPPQPQQTGGVMTGANGMPEPQPDARIILESLTGYLKNEQKMKMADQELKHQLAGGV